MMPLYIHIIKKANAMNKKIELYIKTICRNLNFKKKGIYYVRPIDENMMATLL